MAEQVESQQDGARLGSGLSTSSLVDRLSYSLHQTPEESEYLLVGHTDTIQDPAMTRLLTNSQAGNLRSEGIEKASQEPLRWVSLRRLDRVFGSFQQRHQLLQTQATFQNLCKLCDPMSWQFKHSSKVTPAVHSLVSAQSMYVKIGKLLPSTVLQRHMCRV